MPNVNRRYSVVSEVPAADPEEALAHFSAMLRFEADCWDVHDAMTNGPQDFVLVDVRGPPHSKGNTSLVPSTSRMVG